MRGRAPAGQPPHRWSGCRRTPGGELRACLPRSAGRARRDAQVEQELSIPFRAEDRGRDLAGGLEAQGSGRPDHLAYDASMNGRVAHDALVRLATASLELGLDERDEITTGRFERRRDRREHEPEGDEGDV